MTGFRVASAAAGEVRSLPERLGSGEPPTLIVFFASVRQDGAAIGDALAQAFPKVPVIGCSSNGQFAGDRPDESVVAVAIGASLVERADTSLLPLTPDVDDGVGEGCRSLEATLGPLRDLDPTRHVGLVLLEGASRREESIHVALGNRAPFLPLVGGSAGDDIAFSKTWVYVSGRCESRASVLAILRPTGPFRVMQTCNYVPTERQVQITKLHPDNPSIFLEIDGRPAIDVYSELTGKPADQLGFVDFAAHPLGLMIDDVPWLRSPVAAVDGGGILFACTVVEGSQLSVMAPRDLVLDARRAMEAAEQELSAPVGGALLFNCAYRKLEAEWSGATLPYHHALSAWPHAGIHTNGESHLGHLNQTLTGLLLGRA